YVIPSLVPGAYEVRVVEEGFDSPVQTVTLNGSEHKTGINFSVKKIGSVAGGTGLGGDEASVLRNSEATRQAVTLAQYEEIYPRGAGRELLERHCMGCHG